MSQARLRARARKQQAALELRSHRRGGCVLVSDRHGNPYWALLDESVELRDGRVRAVGAGGAGLRPLLTGEEPPGFVSDGAGGLVYV